MSNGGKNQVLRILADGKVETVVEGRPFEFPNNIALDKDQNAYVCDNYSQAVWKIGPDGKPEKWISGKPLDMPVGVCVAGEKVWIADPHAKMVFQAGFDGKLTPVTFEAPAKLAAGIERDYRLPSRSSGAQSARHRHLTCGALWMIGTIVVIGPRWSARCALADSI